MDIYVQWHTLFYLHAYFKTFSYPVQYQKKDWVKLAKILKNTFTDEQLCALTCFWVFSCSNMYQNIYFFIRLRIRKKNIKLNELIETKYWKTPSQMSSFAHKHVFLYLHAQTNIGNVREFNPITCFFPHRPMFNSSLLELKHIKPNPHLALTLLLIPTLTLTLTLTLKHCPLKNT